MMQGIRGLVARSGMSVRSKSVRFMSTKVIPEDPFPVDPNYVPAIDELPMIHSPQHHNLVSKNVQDFLPDYSEAQVDDLAAKEWYDELLGYVWAPPVQPHQTIQSRPRMRLIDEVGRASGKGGRKSSFATAWIKPGTGKIFVNTLPYVEYFDQLEWRAAIAEAFYITGTVSQFDAYIVVKGGGKSSQSGACKQAIADALQNFDPEFRPTLKMNKLLGRDNRVVERKHTGKKKARKSFTWVKR